MKKLYVFAFVVMLAAQMVVGQYTRQNFTPSKLDITGMTNTVSAWKYMAGNPVCKPNTLAFGSLDNSVWCVGTDSKPYIFNQPAKVWNVQNQMGTAAVYLIVVNQGNPNIWTNVYSLQPTATCNAYGAGWYDLFHWNPNNNTWTQPQAGSCMTMASADYKGNLYAVGWDGNTHVKALFQSTNGGQSWSLWSDSWNFISMADPNKGCALDSGNNIWVVSTSQGPMSYPSIPSGTAAGCIITDSPFVLMAWNTAGQVYEESQASSNAWQAVTGVNVQKAVGMLGHYIFAEESSSGKPYHWNNYAPGGSITYGGTWNSQNGCPSPGNTCHASTTHTVCGTFKFSSGHGVNGQQNCSTQLYTNNIIVNPYDYNPLCDPFVGLSGDTECQMVWSAQDKCNQANAIIGSDGFQVLGVFESVDADAWAGNVSSTPGGPQLLSGTFTDGVWYAESYNNLTNACPLGTVPTCPLETPEHSLFTIGFKGSDASVKAYDIISGRLAAANIGADAPYVYRDAYMELQFPNGDISNECLSVDNEPGWFLWQDYASVPLCK